jgi:GT2 family glycosyltransferase
VSEYGGDAVDICIVAWRTRNLLRACLNSILSCPEVARIVVVDNASADGTAEMVNDEFPGVELIANAENAGFAAANNQAIRAGRSPIVLLLNPDTEIRPGALPALRDLFQEDHRIGAVAAQLLLPDGSIQRSCRSFPEPRAVLFDAVGLSRLFPHSETFGRYRMTYWNHDSRREVDQPMASALALRRAALDDVGLFDEAFPLFFNDVDLCCRLRQAGWQIVFEPRAKVVHHHGQSTSQVRASAVIDSHRGLIRFYRKHYRGAVSWAAYWGVIGGAWLTMYPRAVLSGLARLFR